jgi:hypothetical protein
MILYVCKTECPEYPDRCSGTISSLAGIKGPCGKLGWNNKKMMHIMLNPEVDWR